MDTSNKNKNTATVSPAELKLKEIERKKQIASEVNPSLGDIRTIIRRIDNLKKKMLIQDIEKSMAAEIKLQSNAENILPLLDLGVIKEQFGKLEAKINLKLESL